MIETVQLKVGKKLPFDANQIEQEFEKKNLNVLRWAITGSTEKFFIIEAGIIKK